MSLIDLPPELLERVAEFADWRDLCNLRLVCKDVSAKVLKSFATTCFETLRFHLTETELRRAMDVIDHEDFGKRIKAVRIIIDDIDEGDRDPGYQNRSNYYTAPPVPRELIAARNEQRIMRDMATDIHLLTFIFCKLAYDLEKAPDIEIAEAGAWGKGIAHPIIKRQPPPLQKCRAIHVILKAQAVSGLRPTVFNSYCDDWAMPIQALAMDSRGRYWEYFEVSFAYLQKLQLDIWAFKDDIDRPATKSFVQILTNMPHLQELHLIVRTEARNDFEFAAVHMHPTAITDCLLSAIFLKLQVFWLTMEYAPLRLQELVTFLKKHAVGETGLKSFRGWQLQLTSPKGQYGPEDGRTLQGVLEEATGMDEISLEDCRWVEQ